MRVFAIRDENLPRDDILGYLIYYERQKTFYIELTNKKSSYLQEKDRRKDKYSKQTTAQGWPVNWASSTVIPPHQGHCGYAVPSASLTRRAASTTGQSRGCMATHVNQNCRIQSLVGPKGLAL